MDYKELTEQIVNKCLKKGADAAEVYCESSRNLSVGIRNNEMETVQQAESHGVGIRVMVKGRLAFSSCNDLSEAALEETLSSAVQFASSTTPDENNILPEDKGITEVEGLYDPQTSQIPLETKINLAKEAEKLAMKDSRITRSGGARYMEGEGQVFIILLFRCECCCGKRGSKISGRGVLFPPLFF